MIHIHRPHAPQTPTATVQNAPDPKRNSQIIHVGIAQRVQYEAAPNRHERANSTTLGHGTRGILRILSNGKI